MTLEISDDVRSLFHAELEHRDGAYVLEVPDSEIETGALDAGATYRVVLASSPETGTADAESKRAPASASNPSGRAGAAGDDHSPPVAEGDELAVVIEDQGDEGDGIARVGPGFIVFIPETTPGDRVRIRITDVTGSYAFGEVVERIATTS
ncbi:MAG: TRAM domain-containing protein [Haloferacaceae archaeon]